MVLGVGGMVLSYIQLNIAVGEAHNEIKAFSKESRGTVFKSDGAVSVSGDLNINTGERKEG